MKILSNVLFVVVLASTTTSVQADGTWEEGKDRSGRVAVCSRACSQLGGGRPAVEAGTWSKSPQGAKYFVCAVNVSREGFRVGYNLDSGRFAGECRTGHGGREDISTRYKCLCLTPG